MKEEAITDILNLCLDIDSKAVMIYSRFAKHSKKPALKKFWSQLSAHEEKHTGYWRKLIQLANDDMLPQLFEQPYKEKGS